MSISLWFLERLNNMLILDARTYSIFFWAGVGAAAVEFMKWKSRLENWDEFRKQNPNVNIIAAIYSSILCIIFGSLIGYAVVVTIDSMLPNKAKYLIPVIVGALWMEILAKLKNIFNAIYREDLLIS